jgi:hypothetical protein
MSIYQSHYEPEGEWCPDRGWASQHNWHGNGGSARGREEGAREELEEEMAEAKRRKLMCFQKTCMRVIKKTISAITTTTTATSTITPNLTPKELVKFMEVAVASKYRNNLMNFTHTMTEDVRSTLDTFKTDLQNTLPRQIISVVQ